MASLEPATIEGPITVGAFHGPADPRPLELDALGYVQEEYFVSGVAQGYTAPGELGPDGQWEVEPDGRAPYRTRIVVRRPSDPSRCSGTAVLEWLNVSVVEAAPEWAYTHRALVDAGVAWVGVSAQAHGVIGGASLLETGVEEQAEEEAGGLRGLDPERYGTLEHPGDGHSFDIYTGVGAAVLAGLPGLGEVDTVIAAGESQSAAYLTGYINGIQPLTGLFQGFFVHSRGGGSAVPTGEPYGRDSSPRTRMRTDLDAKIMVVESETDVGPVFRFGPMRQPDTTCLRIWESAGTAHADAYLVGGEFELCPRAINNGPQHYVTHAAIEALLAWVDAGDAPPSAPRLTTDPSDATRILRDELGIARGGIRTPSVDVPIAVLSGDPDGDASELCALFGSSTPLDPATLRELYGSPAGYRRAFERSLDEAIEARFVRRADRELYLVESAAVTF